MLSLEAAEGRARKLADDEGAQMRWVCDRRAGRGNRR